MKKVLPIMALMLSKTTLAASGTEPAVTVQPTATTAAMTEPTATTAAMEATATLPPRTAATATTASTTGETPTTGAMTGGTLADIKARGRLIAGVKYDVRIFGYLNPETNKVEGFDVDLAKAVAERIFGDPEKVEFVEAISANRIPYLEQGKADVIFSTMTANEDRAKQIEFSDTYYVAGQSLLVPINSSIASIKDLDGKTVGTVKGSTSEKNIAAKAPSAKIELFDAYAAAVQAMDAGRVEAVTTDDIILYGFQRNSPDKFKVVGGQFTQEPYAAGIKKGNTELLAEVNATLRDLKQTGKWAEIYKKWIGSDPTSVPPQEWRDVYKQPTATP